MIKTDIIIVGAGPVGLFAIFEAGLMKLRCHLIDALPQPGGQLSEIYPKKPIYDIPGFPSVLAGDLVDNLMEQAKPFNPGFTLGDRAEKIEKQADGTFIVTTLEGVEHHAPVVMIAGGLGSFEPRRPLISNLGEFEKNGVDYIVRDPEKFRDKDVVISGGGDSALDWAIFLAEGVAKSVTLIHRSEMFRAHKDSVDKAYKMRDSGRIKFLTNAEVIGLQGEDSLESISVEVKGEEAPVAIKTDYWLPLFGLSPKLGPIGEWGLEIDKNAIKVDNTLDYQTNIPGVFAIGDVNTYPGKLKLILCGFHEATLAVQTAYKIVHPDKKFTMKYTTVQGVQGLEKEEVVAQ
ncbi:MAG: NAD(P)/FAD-dependent oxidoreductase [Flavobacteriales bacterium]|nr:NAD(P)/FAD-dependent oxidoreductase [Flavobacteriales bacterium]